MSNFKTGTIIESQVPQWLPVLLYHARWRRAEFFGNGA